jgi:hypothetical protein
VKLRTLVDYSSQCQQLPLLTKLRLHLPVVHCTDRRGSTQRRARTRPELSLAKSRKTKNSTHILDA